jgi:hypothetical protein
MAGTDRAHKPRSTSWLAIASETMHPPAKPCATRTLQYRPGEIVPQSGIYTDMPHEVTVIKGRRFPTCRHCKGISFELSHAAKHVGEIDHLEEAHAPA